MLSIAIFHALALLLVVGIVTRLVPPNFVGEMLVYLHKSIGITTPSQNQVRMVALIWIASAVIIVDGCILLLVFITSSAHQG
jgi:hypothetical protein